MALLISILLPSLMRSRALGLAMECTANLRQLGVMHQASLDMGRWGSSAYDLKSDSNSGGDGTAGYGNRNPPVRADQRGAHAPLNGEGFSEGMEFEARDQPRHWGLLCTVGYRNDRNSYGIAYTARQQPFEILTTDDVVMGCSDYLVVDVPSNFALRHQGEASFLFGDLHANTRRLDEVFDESLIDLQSNRLPPRRLDR